MSRKPSDGIGARVARYRRLAGLSAREVAERAGYGLTRGVIANIESGRKTDITVDQLIALAATLGVPPVVIALPVETPFLFVRVRDGENSNQAMRAYVAADWFMADDVWFPRRAAGEVMPETGEATAAASLLLHAVRDHPREVRNLERVRELVEAGKADEAMVREREAEAEGSARTIRQLGGTVKIFKVGE